MRGNGRRSLRERLAEFMWERNGYDGLGRFMLRLALVMVIINLFLDSLVLSAIESAVMLYVLFRVLSKNLERRRAENAAYYRISGRVKGFFSLQKNKWRDRKTHVYRKCPFCKNTLRLPRKKGRRIASCPCCHNKFDVRIR